MGIVGRRPTVLGHLLHAGGEQGAGLGLDDDVRRPFVLAVQRVQRPVREHRCGPEVEGGGVVAEAGRRIPDVGAGLQPQQPGIVGDVEGQPVVTVVVGRGRRLEVRLGDPHQRARVDGRLAVLGREDHLGGAPQALLVKFGDQRADLAVDGAQRRDHLRREGQARLRLDVPAGHVVGVAAARGVADAGLHRVDELLAHRNRLEVHPEDVGDADLGVARRVEPVDLVLHRRDLDAVVEHRVGHPVGDGQVGSGEVRRRHVGVDLRREEVVDRLVGARPLDDLVGGVLVRPGGAQAGGVGHAEDRVDLEEVPGLHRVAAVVDLP